MVPNFAKKSNIFTLAGELSVEQAPVHLITVLGSCVSVCLWSVKLKMGGLNHFLFPYSSPEDRTARHGDVAMAQLLDKMMAAGAPRAGLVAKVFGGASSGRFRWDVGAGNILSAWEALAKMRIPILATDVAGQRGRHIDFDVATGIVRVRYLAEALAHNG